MTDRKDKRKFIGGDAFRLREAPITGILIVVLFTLGIILLPVDWLGKLMTADAVAVPLIGGLLLRCIGFAALYLLRLNLGFVPKKPRLRDVLTVAPFLVTAIWNLPIIALATGAARVTGAPWVVVVYAFWCLSVALIEETAFRGLVFPLVLAAWKAGKYRNFWGVVVSSAVFGLIHLVNLLGGNVGAVFLQVGYSFLIGCICAVAVLRTGSIVPAVVFHAVYNFCGLLIPTVGTGALWDVPTVVSTAVLGVAMAAYVVFVLLKTPPEAADALFLPRPKATE